MKLFEKKTVSLADKNLSFPRIRRLNSQTLILDGVDTGVLLSDFSQQLHRKKGDASDICLTLFALAGKSPTQFLNQNAKTKKRGSLLLFKT